MTAPAPKGDPNASERRAGIIIKTALRRHFVAAQIARKVAPRPTVTPVPGAEFGMALISGQVVGVIELGGPAGSLLLCEVSGQLLALSGIVAEHSGFFEPSPGGVLVDGELVPDLDVAAMASSISRKLGDP